MRSNSCKKLIEEANKFIPIYTIYLETCKRIMEDLSKTIEMLNQVDPKNNIEVFNDIERMTKFNALLTISLLDLMVVCKNMCLAQTNWEKIYFIKQGYLTIYETIITYHKHSPMLRNTSLIKYSSFENSLDDIKKDLKHFKKIHNYESEIGLIRNKVAGHTDEDFVLYYDIIIKLDGEKAVSTISHFIKILTRHINLTKDLTAHANSKIQN